ncbi:hypothetical protein NW768_000969 [Fusarium equiseti]|uniref:LamG-like jellyroll fold domain-containing protein n=1 Tax=Fusarium equiseti TaxID=61235 RepID=A0ABQ8RUQ7_FUSEQ|nr:hypothetical protein NW768_000969 [Fusarium equiseti]
MSLEEILAPNLNRYTARAGGRYLSTRLVTHNGVTIAIALGKGDKDALFFGYSILNAEEADEAAKAKESASDEADKLDSQCWFENVKTLEFPSEVRVVGEEAVPVYEIPAVDYGGRKAVRALAEKSGLDPWLSSSLCLMNPQVTDFQVLSDGRYVYLFRQGASAPDPKSAWPNKYMTNSEAGNPPVDSNLLCDRFTLVGTSLIQPLEVRFQRSRQKQIPLNDQDTLSARDINNQNFYEPTHSLRFVQNLAYGRFSIVRAPTVINDVTKWIIFAYSRLSCQVECLITDVATNGLFDLHGHVYYTCESENHAKVFANGPGPCTASRNDTGQPCNDGRVPILPKSAASKRAIGLKGAAKLRIPKAIDLSTWTEGFTLEAWVNPQSLDESVEDSVMCLFSQGADGSPYAVIDNQFRLSLCLSGKDGVLVTSDKPVETNKWTHVAVSYSVAERSYNLIINGEAVGTVISPVLPGQLTGLGYQDNNHNSSFVGVIDEVRFWNRPSLPASIKANMFQRATGLDPDLEACWHFDEESGTTAFDSSLQSRHMNITSIKSGPLPPDLWTQSVAPMIAGHGLSRQILRLPSAIIDGGIGASIYYEQVTISADDARKKNGKDPSDDTNSKQMKRGARVLLCFVTSVGRDSRRLAVLDFGLLSDGTLPDTPASIPLPSLSPTVQNGQLRPCIPTSLLYVGSQGVEIFGGILEGAAAACGSEAPCVFESAMGIVTIFFRAMGPENSKFSAINYDISRSVIAADVLPSVLGGQEGLLATSKLQQAKSVVFQTDICSWAPPELAVDLTVTANMNNGQQIIETWIGVPPQLDRLYALLNGNTKVLPVVKIGTMAELKEIPKVGHENIKGPLTELTLEKPLTDSVTAGTYLAIGRRYYMVLQDAKPGASSIVMSLQRDEGPKRPPKKTTVVEDIGYEVEKLVKSVGKSAGNFSLGSSLVTMAWSPSVTIEGRPPAVSNTKIQAPSTSFIHGGGQSPTFSSPPTSTALLLDGSTVYSALEEGVTTAPCPGICFESWIKVDNASQDTIAVGYTSEHSPRAEGLPKEQQTFTLGVPKLLSGDEYELLGSINGLDFNVKQKTTLKLGRWTHVACSAHNTFAVQCSGTDYIDLGKSAEWNVSDFSIVFTLRLDPNVSGEQTILVKSESATSRNPIHIKVTSSRQLQLSYWAADENGGDAKERNFYSPSDKPLIAGEAYKVFISRELHYINKPNAAPRSYQLVTMRAWRSDGSVHMSLSPDTVASITDAESKATKIVDYSSGSKQTHGPALDSVAPLCLGGASWIEGCGLQGIIGSIFFYSAPIPVPGQVKDLLELSGNSKGLLASWSCHDASDLSLVDDLGRNNGRFKGAKIHWTLSPYKPDLRLSVFVNGIRVDSQRPSDSQTTFLKEAVPAGPHQLTIGNVLVAGGNDDARFLRLPQNFRGEFDELRIWNIPRARESICDSMHTSLTEMTSEIAAYFQFNDEVTEATSKTTEVTNKAILLDSSFNCCHLTPLFGAGIGKVTSQAPVGHESPCVSHTLCTTVAQSNGAVTCAGPSVAEYGDVEMTAKGSLEGSFKRAYSYIDKDDKWCLVTGFRIGALKTDWVSSIQTAPTLIGFIEGAPPIPAESFDDPDDHPATSVNFRQSKKCTYSYSSRFEHQSDITLSTTSGGGAKWQVSAGLGVETETTSGEIKATRKTALDVSAGLVNNQIRASTTNVNMEMGVRLLGTSKEREGEAGKKSEKYFEPFNTGTALVESETADLFALRLKTHGSVAPLIAYQLRPSLDGQKARNLVTFDINPAYTKQGCLDGRRGTVNDPDYPPMAMAPKDASYYKPAEAYALRDRIRRAEEQWQGEYDRHSLLLYAKGDDLPQRKHRNICNSYVWTANGGMYREETSQLDTMHSEVGGNLNTKVSIGATFDMEVAFGNSLGTVGVDAMYSAHFNFNMAKETNSEEGFELAIEAPPPVDIKYKDKNGLYVKKPGAVDAYRWMSFWLEPSVEATDTFFEQVVDPKWLEECNDSDARLMRSLREALSKETGNARTKAWRVLHRCTYVSRVLEKVEHHPSSLSDVQDEKKATPLADVACNWVLIQRLEPFARMAESRAQLPTLLRPHVTKLFPSLVAQPKLYAHVLDLMADFIGLL